MILFKLNYWVIMPRGLMLVTWSVYCSGLKSRDVTKIFGLKVSVHWIGNIFTPRYMKGKNSLYLWELSFAVKLSAKSDPLYYYIDTTKNPRFVER